jgi:hypothetical protein
MGGGAQHCGHASRAGSYVDGGVRAVAVIFGSHFMAKYAPFGLEIFDGVGHSSVRLFAVDVDRVGRNATY